MIVLADLEFDPRTTHPLNAYPMIYTGAKRTKVMQVFWLDESLRYDILFDVYLPCFYYAKELGLRIEAKLSSKVHGQLLAHPDVLNASQLKQALNLDDLKVVYLNTPETVKAILKDPWFVFKQWDYLAALRFLGYGFLSFALLNFVSVQLNASRYQSTLDEITRLSSSVRQVSPIQSALLHGAYVARHQDLLALNEDGKGWLKIPNTTIDFPIVQTTNNDFYLFHDVAKQPSSYGSIYLDYRVQDFNDAHVVIYGHAVRHQAMFGPLIEFTHNDYLHDHRLIEVVDANVLYRYQIISVHLVDASITRLTLPMNPDQFNTELQRYLDASMHAIERPTQHYNQLLTLISCEYSYDDGRIFVHGLLVEKVVLSPEDIG